MAHLPLIWSRKSGFPLMIPCNGSGRRCVCRSSTGFSLLFGTGWRILSGVGGWAYFLVLRWLADGARHPGVVACAASGRGQGLAQPLAPYDPQPRVGAAIPDGQHDYAGNALCPLPAAWQRAFGLPLSRAHAGRASDRRRSFRPFRGGDLLRALPRLRWETSRSPFFPIRGQPSPHAGRNGVSSHAT